ncbi:MAG TPA: hypothetical protein VE954_36065 [Oligoflexus sp.]|uniref:hypothetical protein n=1 Tax=Oligoflexus sp. TaxID=1971216 RepID=UPI002D728F65|nr:hypothetical protein [Oligoflexus sp.]HYX38550.1 hypothetical protein [Oligoflexus sp.]
MRLMMLPAILALMCCAHSGTNAAESPKETTAERKAESETTGAKEHFKEGWENIKEGGREVAAGVATGVSTGAKKAGAAIQGVACPIAADMGRGIYYAKDSPGYDKMLSAEKSDVRECFATEAGAREKGYTLVR